MAAEPTLVFVFDYKQWTTQLTPLTKLELMDSLPGICTQFFLDKSANAYIMTLTKTTWETFTPEVQIKFKTLSRRLREEVEGPMTQQQRDEYDKADLFELYSAKQAQAQAQAPQGDA